MDNYTSHIIIPDLKLIVTYFEGSIGLNDLVQLNIQFLADELYDPSYDMLMDFRKSTALAFKVDLEDYFDFFKKNVSLPHRIKNGILYTTPNLKFLLSIYKPVAKFMKIDSNGFRQLDAYIEWMEYTDQEKLKIEEAIEAIRKR